MRVGIIARDRPCLCAHACSDVGEGGLAGSGGSPVTDGRMAPLMLEGVTDGEIGGNGGELFW